jgi:hypothetical protein
MMRLVCDDDFNSNPGGGVALLSDEDAQAQLDLDTPAENPVWPHEVDMVISALDAAKFNGQRFDDERRQSSRLPMRQPAVLFFHSDPMGSPGWELFSRDCDTRGVGFITRHRLPLGYSGEIELATPAGEMERFTCSVIRCRPAGNGWYEGAVRFSKPQAAFAVGA